MINLEELKIAMGDLDEDAVLAAIQGLADAGGEGAAEALAACQAGMDIIGEKYENGTYFVADLIYAGDIMGQAAALLKPLLGASVGTGIGKLVICTVKGDIHDIGKNIVKALLEAEGIEVIDLGVDTAADKVVAALKESGAKVLAMSGVLTIAVEAMKNTIAAIQAAGLSDTKVIIGGACATEEYCAFVGADAWSINAAEGAGICRQWLAG